MSENQNETFKMFETPQPKQETIFSKSEKIMSLLSIVFSFLFVHFAIWNTSGFFTTLLYIAIITAGIIFMRNNGYKFSKLNILIAVILYVFSFVFSVTANKFIKFLDLIFLVTIGAYFVYSVSCGKRRIGRFFPFEIIKSLIEFPFMHFSKEYEAISSLIKKTKFGTTAKLILAGLISAVPLTFVVSCLLMSADSGVEKILIGISNILLRQNIFSLAFEFLISIPASFWLFGMFYKNVHSEASDMLNEESCEKLLEKGRTINNVIVYTSVTPICFLYIIFFISQLTYFMSAFFGNLPENYSYAEYARKGFFELFAIEIINTAVIFFMNLFTKRNDAGKPKLLKFYTVLILLFTLLITATSLSKMIMYIDAYGLTQLRVYTSWFMILTFMMFILAIISQIKSNFHSMPFYAAIFTVMFAVLCFSRPDALITKYNLETYDQNHEYKISSSYIIDLAEMSDDAVAVILDEKYSEQIREALEYKSFWSEYIDDLEDRLDGDIYERSNISAIIIRSRL